MSLTVYGIKNCNTMKKAFDFLQAHDVAYEFFDYKKSVVPEDVFLSWVATFGLDKVINKQGTTYRKLSEADKAVLMSDDLGDIYRLVCQHQSMIKRPIVIGSQLADVALIGYDEKAYQEALLNH